MISIGSSPNSTVNSSVNVTTISTVIEMSITTIDVPISVEIEQPHIYGLSNPSSSDADANANTIYDECMQHAEEQVDQIPEIIVKKAELDNWFQSMYNLRNRRQGMIHEATRSAKAFQDVIIAHMKDSCESLAMIQRSLLATQDVGAGILTGGTSSAIAGAAVGFGTYLPTLIIADVTKRTDTDDVNNTQDATTPEVSTLKSQILEIIMSPDVTDDKFGGFIVGLTQAEVNAMHDSMNFDDELLHGFLHSITFGVVDGSPKCTHAFNIITMLSIVQSALSAANDTIENQCRDSATVQVDTMMKYYNTTLVTFQSKC
jgi:hypothetical protein